MTAVTDTDKIVKALIKSGSIVFNGEGYDQKTLYKILQHPDFPIGIKVKYPD
jgi:hypothetical protein